MPIVDGVGSTKLIRDSEQSTSSNNSSSIKGEQKQIIVGNDSGRNNPSQNRIPIFAVSASLMEKDRQSYIDSGFDGWIMKPIDFHRVNYLLNSVSEDEMRNSSVYEPGMWEKGGWFERKPT